jgi:glycosyltransferase involved in cell wall biosynthesis
MRVLLLDQFSDLGGGQRMLLDLLNAIRKCGWKAALGLPGEGPLSRRAHAMGVEVFTIPCGPYASGRKSPGDLWHFQMEMPRLARRIRELVRTFAPDLVYVNGPRLLPAASMSALDLPVLFHAHIGVSQRMARLVAGVSLRVLGPRVVAVCQNVANAWQPFIPGQPVRVVYNGVAGPERGTLRVGDGALTIGCVGRIAREKGQREFLAAAREIQAAVPEARFVIAGAALFGDRAAESYERTVREAAAGLPVEFTGWVDDVYSVMSRLDLLIVPSVWDEPNPRVILEAFAAGVPVLALRTGGIPEIVDDGRTAFLCDDPGGLALRAIQLLTGDRSTLRDVAETAKDLWRREFTVETWQQRMIAEMEDCVAVRAAARGSADRCHA